MLLTAEQYEQAICKILAMKQHIDSANLIAADLAASFDVVVTFECTEIKSGSFEYECTPLDEQERELFEVEVGRWPNQVFYGVSLQLVGQKDNLQTEANSEK